MSHIVFPAKVQSEPIKEKKLWKNTHTKLAARRQVNRRRGGKYTGIIIEKTQTLNQF
jgi:hypothetical protein